MQICRFAPDALYYEATPVENSFLLEHMHHADGVQLRVYLYGLMLCRYPAMAGAALEDALQLKAQEIFDAFAYWQREGLLAIRSVEPLEVEYFTPSSRATQKSLVPGKYHSLVQASQFLFSPRVLRASELRQLYDWVEVYLLSEEVVLELLAYCVKRKGKSISMQYMDKVARSWAEQGVDTVEAARAQTQAHEALTDGAAKILQRFMRIRPATRDELDLYQKWVGEWGFTEEAVLAACPALTSADKPSFKYLDSVLKSLHEGGIRTEDGVLAAMSGDEEERLLANEVFAKLGLARAAKLSERKELMLYVRGGLEKALLLYAAAQSFERERPYAALKRLLKEYEENGIKSVDAAQEYTPKQRESKKPKADALDYEQKSYVEQELQHIYIDLDE